LTREKLVDALDSISNLDLGGVKMSLSATNHQASSAVFLTRVKAGKVEAIANGR
jgi:hypothetical protein